jgi:integrase
MSQDLIPSPQVDLLKLVDLAVATCPSRHTRRAYASRITEFLKTGLTLDRDGLATHLQALQKAGKGKPEQRLTMAAIRKLASEAQLRGLISHGTLASMVSVSPGRYTSTKSGQWLTVEELQQLSAAPDRTTYWGLRDAAVLSVLAGCGLRRSEAAELPWSCYASREGRMCLVDFVGKGGKVRTVPVPKWAERDIDAWKKAFPNVPTDSAHTNLGATKRHSERRDTRLMFGGLGDQGISKAVSRYAEVLGYDLSPHDLRRTLAKLLRSAGAPLEQIQYTLGHADIKTTMIYLGHHISLRAGEAAVDKILMGYEVERNPESRDDIARGIVPVEVGA